MNLRIMAIDDEPAVLQVIKLMVEPLGVEVVTLADSREATERVRTEAFDAFLVDARMPHVDGFQLTQCIRNSPANAQTPVAMLTGADDGATMRQGFRAGVTFFIGKPFTRERACSLVSAMRGLALRQRRRHTRLPYETTVDCSAGERGESHFRAESLNIGEDGLLVAPSGGVEVGQELQLMFTVPTRQKPLRPRAKVLRKEPSGCLALHFTSIDPDERQAVGKFIFGSQG